MPSLHRALLAAAALVALLSALPLRAGEDSPVVTLAVEGEYAEVLQNLNSAITGRGINIAHTLGASDMLNRTGPDFGYADRVYSDAAIVEFCSARLSHELSRANPHNILLCPFAVAVYALEGEPGKVYLSYRPPRAPDDPRSQAAARAVLQLLEGIVAEAAAW